MSQQDKPFVWQMVKQAAEALGPKTTNVAIRDWILEKYPDTNKHTIQCQIIVCTVNHASRIYYTQNQKPRIADSEYDILYKPAVGEVELFDPERHGRWEIYEKEDGQLGVKEVGSEGDDEPDSEAAFAAEAHLQAYLANHIGEIEPGLQLFVDDNGNDGVEYVTDVGRIDILAVDQNDGLVVIELKVSRGPDSVAGQILRYKNWVKRHLAEDRQVRGIIIAQRISEKVQYAIADDPDICCMEYDLQVTLRDVPCLQVGTFGS